MNNYIFKDGSKIFFTSDLHFDHANIIKFCNRPYSNVEEMNQSLIENWNKVVPKDGIVFLLGDFCFGGLPAWEKWRNKLNGTIYLILGNHDIKNVKANSFRMSKMFECITSQIQIQIEGQSIYLNHFPFLCYGGSYRNVWQLYGHVHSGPKSISGKDISRIKYCFPTQYDVGVDNNNFTPISWNQLKECINNQINNSKKENWFDKLKKKFLNKK